MGLDLSNLHGKEAHTAAIQSIVEACNRANKIPGISTGKLADTRFWLDQGCLFVTVGEDSGWMVDGARETLRQLGR